MISQDIIERVRSETDIVGLIGEYVKLKRAGRSFVGLCPFHTEKTPSFNVSPDRQAYYCFGCNAGGNAITFIMNYENLSFPEAVKRLAERLGIRVEYTEKDDPTKPMVEALELAHKLYQETLWSKAGLSAQRYLVERGLKKETVKSFELGLVPHDITELISLAREAKLTPKVLSESGVLGTKSGRFYPFLSGRIVFPLYTSAGKLVGFSGRIWGDDPNPAKYVNTPETTLFKKGRILYGLSRARAYLRREGAIVVEGQMDVVRLTQAGFHNVVAPLGTAFTTDHAGLLSRYAEKVILVFDGDEPGRKAARRALEEVLAVDLDVSLLLLPEGEDPDSFLGSHPASEFRDLLDSAKEPIPFLFLLSNPEGSSQRRQTAKQMMAIISRVRDRLRRELYLDEAAELLSIDRNVLAGLMSSDGNTRGTKTSNKGTETLKKKEEQLLRMMIQDDGFIRIAAERLSPEVFPEGDERELLKRLYDLVQSRDKFSAGEILDTLEPRLRSRVSRWSLSEVQYSRDEFIKALAHYLFRKRRDKLRRELKEAERVGDTERARSILSELNELVKESSKIYQEI
ncbi:DNA primase [candidate division WOR-3 bacterium]|nr:DNA primase [candidate division WOR-3 bacterium]